MRLALTVLLTLALLPCFGCASFSERQSAPGNSNMAPDRQGGASAPAPREAQTDAAQGRAAQSSAEGANVQPVAETTDAQAQAPTARRIIRKGEFTIETDAPAAGQQRIAAIAEARGGYVVTSEARQRAGETAPSTVVTVTIRVPAEQFAQTVEEIRGTGGRMLQERITGQDVTEEYADLEARLRAQRALEAQFLEILRQARSVPDALNVQNELGRVRTEIERLEGRRRFLENQAALSTITVTLQPPSPGISGQGFFAQLKRAVGSGLDAAMTITLGLVQIFLALIPLALFIVLPLVLLIRFLLRRARRRRRLAQELQAEAQAQAPPS